MGVRVEGSSPRLGLGLVLRHAPALFFWGHRRAASGLPCGRLTDLESGPHRGRGRVSLPERLGVSAVLYYESWGGGEGVVHFASPKGAQVAVGQH